MHKAIDAVLDCRTERYGQMTLSCPPCPFQAQRYHSRGHRSCPACQHYDTGEWLERQAQKLLPVDYYMATFTLPRELRNLFWYHQRTLYALAAIGLSSPCAYGRPRRVFSHPSAPMKKRRGKYLFNETDLAKVCRARLSRYLYRGVISEHNIIEDDGTLVTFRYRDGDTNTLKTRQLIQMVLNVILPALEPKARPASIRPHCQVAMRIIAFTPPQWRSG